MPGEVRCSLADVFRYHLLATRRTTSLIWNNKWLRGLCISNVVLLIGVLVAGGAAGREWMIAEFNVNARTVAGTVLVALVLVLIVDAVLAPTEIYREQEERIQDTESRIRVLDDEESAHRERAKKQLILNDLWATLNSHRITIDSHVQREVTLKEDYELNGLITRMMDACSKAYCELCHLDDEFGHQPEWSRYFESPEPSIGAVMPQGKDAALRVVVWKMDRINSLHSQIESAP